MTLNTLFYACSDMDFTSTFVLADLLDDMKIKVFDSWYDIPEEEKERYVSSFSFSDSEWYICVR